MTGRPWKYEISTIERAPRNILTIVCANFKVSKRRIRRPHFFENSITSANLGFTVVGAFFEVWILTWYDAAAATFGYIIYK